MFMRIYSIEHTKLMRRHLPWILLGILAGAVLLVTAINYLVLASGLGGEVNPAMIESIESQITWPGGLFNAVSLAGGSALGGFLVVILSGTTMAQEYTWRTLQQWLGRGVPRPLFLAAKFAALLLPIALMVLVPLLVGGALTALFTINLQGSLHAAAVDWSALATRAVATAYTLLPYAALTFLLAVATRSTVAAVGIGIAFALLIEGIILQMASLFNETLAALTLYLPAGLSQSLLESQRAIQVTADGGSLAGTGPELLAPGVAIAGIAIYTVVFLALSMIIFRRQDLNE
jgi:ABC-2 type transport system permease protein